MGIPKPRVWPADQEQRKWLREQRSKQRVRRSIDAEVARILRGSEMTAELRGVLDSRGDTLTDEEVLHLLRAWDRGKDENKESEK